MMKTMFFMSFVYLLLISIVYFCKSRLKTKDNKIYEVIIFVNAFGLIFDYLQVFLAEKGVSPSLLVYLNKFFLVYVVTWTSIFVGYVLNINLDNKSMIILKLIKKMYFIVCFLILILPLKFFVDNKAIYSEGAALIITYIYVMALIVSMFMNIIVDILKNRKVENKKKYIPLFLFAILGAIGLVVQAIKPEFLLVSPIETFITILTFFFIENPDMKMIEELQVARDQAEKANRAKTDFLSSMSHEIRTPLNAIVGFSDCIIDSNNLDEAKENAVDIVNASQTLLEIVNGILDISKIEAGKIEIVNSPYNANEVFTELAKLITPKMNEKGLEFSYSIAPDLPPTLFGDHANLKKVITNLLSNACKYTDRGFVHYEVNCVNSNNVSKLIISVEDSGRGIKKENIDKMFTKFQRLDEDRNTTIEGTGLGLAITKQLIELMGGRIIVHTIYGEGSKFTVVLNQKIENTIINDVKKVKSTLDLHDVKILLVDDTSLNLKVACKLLEKYNANMIDTCSSGFECIDKINSGNEYDLILLDDMMPKMSGVTTLKRLKENPNFKIPTIALTANAITGMREKYLNDGFDDYLAKPIEKEQLIRVVNQVLGRNITEELEKIPNEGINNEPINKVEEVNNLVIPVEDNDIKEEIIGRTRNMPVLNNIKEDSIENLEVNDDVANSSDNNKYDRCYLEKNGASIDKALELLGDMEMYNMTINDFVEEVDDKWQRIIDYKNSNNMADYAIEVHSLKSDCKYLGFMGLADIAYEHELKSKENDSEFVKNNFQRLENEYKRVHDVVFKYVEHNSVE